VFVCVRVCMFVFPMGMLLSLTLGAVVTDAEKEESVHTHTHTLHQPLNHHRNKRIFILMGITGLTSMEGYKSRATEGWCGGGGSHGD